MTHVEHMLKTKSTCVNMSDLLLNNSKSIQWDTVSAVEMHSGGKYLGVRKKGRFQHPKNRMHVDSRHI